MSLSLEEGLSVYPYVFPIRNAARPPEVLAVRAGYYCIDTFTPLNRNAYLAACRGIDCTLTAAHSLLEGFHLAYALVRPPGHHAERRSFGGFCYFNNAAAAAQYLSRFGRIAILDIDYHHGNGQQQIFYGRSDVLTVSIHGHPRFAYPISAGSRRARQRRGQGLQPELSPPRERHDR
jgi:acetoin utilization deacetylase AcuC-like enzyme